MRNRGRRGEGETSRERIRTPPTAKRARAERKTTSGSLWPATAPRRFPLETNLSYRRWDRLSCQKRARRHGRFWNSARWKKKRGGWGSKGRVERWTCSRSLKPFLLVALPPALALFSRFFAFVFPPSSFISIIGPLFFLAPHLLSTMGFSSYWFVFSNCFRINVIPYFSC